MSPLVESACFVSAANGFNGLIVDEEIHLINSGLVQLIFGAVDRIYF